MKFLKNMNIKNKFEEILSVYDMLYYTKKVMNDSEKSTKLPSRKDKITIDFSGTYDGTKITYYYLIESLPMTLFKDFKNRIRRECSRGVRVNFINHLRPHDIDWESPAMKSRLRILQQVGEENNSSNVNAYNLHKNISSLNKQSWVEESLSYLAIADRQRDRSLIKMTMIMTISGERGEHFDDSVITILETTKALGLKAERVLYTLPDLLKQFSPFSKRSTKTYSTPPTQVLTDEILARFNTYDQGTLGKRGVNVGIDVNSRYPVMKVFKLRDDAAENLLATAETGGGKSHLVKDLALQLLGLNFVGTIMDIEGFEYSPLANFVSNSSKVVVLNMSEGSGNYLDPVEIPAMTGVEDIDKEAKKLSMNFVLSFFKTLVGDLRNDHWVDTALNDGIGYMYKEAGITEDRETWVNSKGKSLFDVYEAFKVLSEKRYRDNEKYMEALESIIAKSSRYFEPDGTRSSMLKNRINVDKIIEADLLVCSFGMAGKSPQSIDEVQLNLMQLGAAHLSHQRSIFSKAQGKFNFKIWEEFQRWGNFPDSDKTIGVALTGGRKLGDVNIIVTNDVGSMLKENRFGIWGNITSYLIGAIDDSEVRRELCRRLSIMHMLPDLDRIASAKRDDDDGDDTDLDTLDPLTYAFLCGLDRSKFGIVRKELPKAISSSNLFKTGVDLAGNVKNN